MNRVVQNKVAHQIPRNIPGRSDEVLIGARILHHRDTLEDRVLGVDFGFGLPDRRKLIIPFGNHLILDADSDELVLLPQLGHAIGLAYP